MRLTKLALSSFAALAISLSAVAQQAPQRDAQAISILNQSLNTAGGAAALSEIRDFSASGTIAYYWAGEEVRGSVSVRGRGTAQFRLDATLPEGLRSWVASNGAGSLREANGNTTRISYHNAINFGGLSFPYFCVLDALNDSTTSISLLGVVTTNGRDAYRIRVQKTFPADADPDGILTKLNTKDLFIDTATFQISGTFDMIHPEKDSTQDHPHEIEFSDYRSVNGVLVPFSVTERIGGQRTWTIQLSAIRFNAGLTDANFRL